MVVRVWVGGAGGAPGGQWWWRLDSNQCRPLGQEIYSLPQLPLCDATEHTGKDGKKTPHKLPVKAQFGGGTVCRSEAHFPIDGTSSSMSRMPAPVWTKVEEPSRLLLEPSGGTPLPLWFGVHCRVPDISGNRQMRQSVRPGWIRSRPRPSLKLWRTKRRTGRRAGRPCHSAGRQSARQTPPGIRRGGVHRLVTPLRKWRPGLAGPMCGWRGTCPAC